MDDPGISPAPDWRPGEHLYRKGELREFCAAWGLSQSRSFVFDDGSAGIPHRHAAEGYVFRQPS